LFWLRCTRKKSLSVWNNFFGNFSIWTHSVSSKNQSDFEIRKKSFRNSKTLWNFEGNRCHFDFELNISTLLTLSWINLPFCIIINSDLHKIEPENESSMINVLVPLAKRMYCHLIRTSNSFKWLTNVNIILRGDFGWWNNSKWYVYV
jgi:hypothetical protein